VLDLYLGLSRAVKYDQHEYFGSDTNALPILAGALLALVLANTLLTRTVHVLAALALPALLLLPFLAHEDGTHRPSLVIAAGTGLAVPVVAGVVVRPGSAVGSLLATGPMRWLGQRSYSIYLWNVLARIAVLATLGHTVTGDLVWIAMVVVLAEANFRCVERPLRARLSQRVGDGRLRRALGRGRAGEHHPDERAALGPSRDGRTDRAAERDRGAGRADPLGDLDELLLRDRHDPPVVLVGRVARRQGADTVAHDVSPFPGFEG
jgi:peptidoglycan/LPS O-acetylase OafA/YrhL